MNEDALLLRRYLDARDEAAFAELVRRHLKLVYACALRGVGNDTHLAEDVTQKVFLALARKARTVAARPTIAGWLYVAARRSAAETVRKERRRKAHEQAAASMDAVCPSSGPEIDWKRIRPVLDDLILGLRQVDREAVILRFLEKRSFAEVAEALSLTEEGARKRVERSVEKLRSGLMRRGFATGAAAVAVALAEELGAAVPPGLASGVSQFALAGASSAGAVTAFFSWAGGALTSAAGTTCVLTLAGAGLVGWQHLDNTRMEAQLADEAGLRERIDSLRMDNLRFRRRVDEAVELRHIESATQGTRVAGSAAARSGFASRSASGPAIAAVSASAPSTASATAPAHTPTRHPNITLTDDGTILWEGEPITLDEYLSRLRAVRATQGADAQILFSVSGGAQPGALSYALDQARRAGITGFSLTTQGEPPWANFWLTSGNGGNGSRTGAADVAPPTLVEPGPPGEK